MWTLYMEWVMNNLNFQQLPRCTVDYPLELTPSETATLPHPITSLLKSPHLLGTVQDIEGAFQALLDIAEEIAGVDFCAYISGSPEFDDFEVMSARNVPEQTNTKSPLLVPAQMTRRFGKPVHLDAEASLRFLPTREGWRSASLVAYPLRRDGAFAGALVFGKRGSHPFTTTQVKLLFFLSRQAEYVLPPAG